MSRLSRSQPIVDEVSSPDGAIPRTGRLVSWIGRTFLKAAGWKIEGVQPRVAKAVVIAAPHTSWHDAVFMLATAWGIRTKLSWMVKSDVFVWPFRNILRWIGAVPVDRGRGLDTVGLIARQFEAADGLLLAMAPSGTRRKTDHWKSGFYNIALAADVPIALGFLDYGRRRSGVGELLDLTGDKKADMDRIRRFYSSIRGRFPEQESTIRLRDESSDNTVRESPQPPATC